MQFIAWVKFKKKPTKEIMKLETEAKEAIKYYGIYWTLGGYDAGAVFEAPNEKVVMKMAIRRGEVFAMETLVAVQAEEARKLIDEMTGELFFPEEREVQTFCEKI